jgi:pimeloyl-ACP methyl ester carboxylesterase
VTSFGSSESLRIRPTPRGLVVEAGDQPEVSISHDRTACVFSIPDESSTVVEYLPESGDSQADNVWLDGRLYFSTHAGAQCIPAFIQMRRSSAGFVATLPSTDGQGIFAALAARVTGPLSKGMLRRDPSFVGRLVKNAQKHPKWNADFLELTPAASGKSLVVLVHGTASCCLAAFAPILPLLPTSTLRFEHDTFLSINENARELADLISNAKATRVLLISHSRGGLVARVAAQIVSSHCAVELMTFGTPHQGTPFASAATGGFRSLVSAGAASLRRLPVADPITAALGYAGSALLRTPKGINEMKPKSQFIETLATLNTLDPTLHRSWGGRFPRSHGFRRLVERASRLGLGKENDLVVATDSAVAFGLGTRIDGCAHTNYFSQAAVQTGILSRVSHY